MSAVSHINATDASIAAFIACPELFAYLDRVMEFVPHKTRLIFYYYDRNHKEILIEALKTGNYQYNLTVQYDPSVPHALSASERALADALPTEVAKLHTHVPFESGKTYDFSREFRKRMGDDVPQAFALEGDARKPILRNRTISSSVATEGVNRGPGPAAGMMRRYSQT